LERIERCANVAHHTEVNWRASANVFRPYIHLRNLDASAARIELAVWEVRAQHQQHVAIEHRVVARRKADQASHSNVKWVVPFDIFLASERMHDWRFQPIGQRENLIMCALTSRTAQHSHAALAIEQRGEEIDIVARRGHDRTARNKALSFRRRRVGG
jgi:hypothetical protein